MKKRFLLTLQRIWITFELFGKNGLANHAAAGAYGFLLSAAPVLLIISFFISNILAGSPALAAAMLEHITFLPDFFNVQEFVGGFLGAANPGLGGLVSVIPLFWTARLCALSLRRGLGVIFMGKSSNPVKSTALTLGLALIIILFIFIMLLGSKPALDFFDSINLGFAAFLRSIVLLIPGWALFLVCLGFAALLFYRIGPDNPPKWKDIIPGALACMIFYGVFSAGFSLIINPDRYNLLYGALGMLFLFLVNVYFFFMFFLFGAQMIMVQAASEALLFIRFRQLHGRPAGTPGFMLLDKLFSSPPWPLEKYIREYKEQDLIFRKGSMEDEVYYLLSGKAGVYLDDECRNRIAFINEANFFGEMEFAVSDGRTASIKAETDLSAMLLPRELFRSILQIDPDTDRNVILGLSERLRSNNKRAGA